MIKVIETIEDFKAMETAWDELYAGNSQLTPFQSFKYNFLSWTIFMQNAGNLYIILVLNNNNYNYIEAIFPCYLDKDKTLRFINDRHTDFCSALVRKEKEYDFLLFEETASFMMSDSRIRMIRFDNLEPDNPLMSVLKPFCKTLIVHDFNAYSQIDIQKRDEDKGFVDSIRHINGKKKKNLMTRLRKEHDLELLICHKGNEQPFPMDEVQYLSGVMIEKKERASSYFSSKMIEYWKEMYEAGILSIAMLYQQQEIKSINFMFYGNNRNEYIKWIMLYSDKRYNLVINLKLIELFYNSGGARVNFARGVYDYKMENFHPQVNNLYRLTISKSLWTSIKALMSTNFHYSKMIVKSIIRK